MALSDVLIELLSFSKGELAEVAELLQLELPRMDKLEQAEWLGQHVSMPTLREVAEGYLGSGRSALSWVVLNPVDGDGDLERDAHEDAEAMLVPATASPVNLTDVAAALVELTGAADPFEARLRPAVTTDPQLVNVQHEKDSDLVFLTFVYEAGHRRFVRDFEFRRTSEDAFFHVVLRLSRGVLEVRADGRIAAKVTSGWIRRFAGILGREEQRLLITYRDVEELQARLGGRMDRHDARHEDEDDGYGRHTVTANVKHPDLAKLPRFKVDFADTNPVQSDLLIDYVDSGGQTHEIRLRISTARGTIRCVNHVSNDVMEFVYDAFREVRASRVAALASTLPKQL